MHFGNISGGKIMLKFLKSLFTRKPKKQFVSRKEIKQMYKNMSKNQLILVISNLVHENAQLKLSKKNTMYTPNVIEKAASGFINPRPIQPAPPRK
jgi:hypothetical protein